jgi:8-oxo-dGTP diphosphatase
MSTIWYIVNVEAVVMRGDSYLMIERSEKEQHAPGILSFPGGKVENAGVCSHILEATLRREVLEETGILIQEQVHYLESKSFLFNDGLPVVDIVFLCEYASGEAAVTDPDEVAGVHWMTAAEILTHPKSPPWMPASLELAEQMKNR